MKTRFYIQGLVFGNMLDWCIENFGVAYLTDDNWETYQHKMYNEYGNIIEGRVFIFYCEEDAMAFKLRWL